MERIKGKFTLVLILFSLAINQPIAAQADGEKKKIEFLLGQIEAQKGAKFWRNGSAYTPKQAVEHLRMKWQKAGKSIKTAKDFIEQIASKSSITGKPYLIQMADSQKIETKTFLEQKLSAWKE
jgi:hypothetical protein